MAYTNDCNHRFFVCECVGVEEEGTVHVILACTSCGEVKATPVKVSAKANPLRMLREEKQKG